MDTNTDGQPSGSHHNASSEHSGQSPPVSFTPRNHNLHVSIFDGGMYDSEGFDIFIPSTAVPQTQDHRTKPLPPITLILFKFLNQTSDGAVMEGEALFPGIPGSTTVIAKLAFSSDAADELGEESKVYTHLANKGFSHIPTFYGLFHLSEESEETFVTLLLTSLVPGKIANRLTVDEFRAAIPSINNVVEDLHAHGVVYGDIRLRNIVIHDGIATLINFNNALFTRDTGFQDMDMHALDQLADI